MPTIDECAYRALGAARDITMARAPALMVVSQLGETLRSDFVQTKSRRRKAAPPDRQPAANEKPGNRPGLSRENVQVMKRED
jgi:hypothetical protein